MPFYFNDTTYFITCRTLDGEKIFNTDLAKKFILQQIIQATKKFDLKLFAFVILSNHYHLLFYLDRGQTLKKIVQQINGASSHLINKHNHIYRHIWEKYWQRFVWNEKIFMKVLGYVIGNPLKHQLVKDFNELEKYKFCSFAYTVKKEGREFAEDLILSVNALNLEEVLNFDKLK